MGKAIRFLTGFALGLFAGSMAGLMLAPQSGHELRFTMNDRFHAVVDEGRRAAGERRDELQRQFAVAKQLRSDPRAQAQ